MRYGGNLDGSLALIWIKCGSSGLAKGGGSSGLAKGGGNPGNTGRIALETGYSFLGEIGEIEFGREDGVPDVGGMLKFEVDANGFGRGAITLEDEDVLKLGVKTNGFDWDADALGVGEMLGLGVNENGLGRGEKGLEVGGVDVFETGVIFGLETDANGFGWETGLLGAGGMLELWEIVCLANELDAGELKEIDWANSGLIDGEPNVIGVELELDAIEISREDESGTGFNGEKIGAGPVENGLGLG